jgi:hypothetical protein
MIFAFGGVNAAEEPPAFAEPRDDSQQYDVVTLVDDLDNPVSIAVRPGTQPSGPLELFISESGAGRVIRTVADDPTKQVPVVTGFPLGQWGESSEYAVGPLGLAFLSLHRLAVGTGGLGAGADVIRIYNLPEDRGELTYDDGDQTAGPIASGGRSETGEGFFFSLTTTDRALFAVGRGDERGWILRATLDANRIAGLEPFIATRDRAGVAAPMAAVIDPRARHKYLVVGQMGEPSAERDSRVTMYSPASGAVALTVAAGLRDVVALAYSSEGDLYALDFAWADAEMGGVYRLEAAQVDGRESCRPVKIAAVVRPTALAFAPDGSLYVTAFGDRATSDDPPTGVLLRITPKLETPKL